MIKINNGLLLKPKLANNSEFSDKINPLLISNESIAYTFKLGRDGLVFTDKRVIVITHRGLTSKSADFSSLPYKNIQAFSMEAALNRLSSKMELMFNVGSLELEFDAEVDLMPLAQIIGEYTL